MEQLSGDNRQPWVNASDIGKASFCPYSLYLKKQGYAPNREASALMEKGTQEHRRQASKATLAEARRCYVSTHVYGPEHHITWVLRQWRDNVLQETISGRLFVVLYYWISPIVIKIFGSSEVFVTVMRRVLRVVSWRIEEKWKP